ncbi:MAG: 16S rRNA (cytosine(967)-C(5))-methyltransferase RsmB [Thermostichales cyanobacterium SRBZ-1_bins_19]
MNANPRHWALQVLRQVDQRGALVNLALQGVLPQVPPGERGLVTELVYGVMRRQRTLDAWIEGYSGRRQQMPLLRRILHLGLYQLRYLTQVPPAVAVSTSVELAKAHHLGRLSGVVNGILRQALRDPELPLPADPVQALGVRHSYPDWLIHLWAEELPLEEVEALCQAGNQVPHLDLRVNGWRTTREQVQALLAQGGIATVAWGSSPVTLRVLEHHGDPARWPGFGEGLWTVQEASAQQVVEWLDPQPGQVVVDCCAAPGGKTGHIGEKMHNQGVIYALDHHGGRLRRIQDHARRLGLTLIRPQVVELGQPDWDPVAVGLPAWGTVDRVLVDVPCSGLGTLSRHADARWRQSPDQIAALLPLQRAILEQAQRWLKPDGILVYATCTLNRQENQAQIEHFCRTHPHWQAETQTLWPHRQQQDGFFIARLRPC